MLLDENILMHTSEDKLPLLAHYQFFTVNLTNVRHVGLSEEKLHEYQVEPGLSNHVLG